MVQLSAMRVFLAVSHACAAEGAPAATATSALHLLLHQLRGSFQVPDSFQAGLLCALAHATVVEGSGVGGTGAKKQQGVLELWGAAPSCPSAALLLPCQPPSPSTPVPGNSTPMLIAQSGWAGGVGWPKLAHLVPLLHGVLGAGQGGAANGCAAVQVLALQVRVEAQLPVFFPRATSLWKKDNCFTYFGQKIS